MTWTLHSVKRSREGNKKAVSRNRCWFLASFQIYCKCGIFDVFSVLADFFRKGTKKFFVLLILQYPQKSFALTETRNWGEFSRIRKYSVDGPRFQSTTIEDWSIEKIVDEIVGVTSTCPNKINMNEWWKLENQILQSSIDDRFVCKMEAELSVSTINIEEKALLIDASVREIKEYWWCDSMNLWNYMDWMYKKECRTVKSMTMQSVK